MMGDHLQASNQFSHRFSFGYIEREGEVSDKEQIQARGVDEVEMLFQGRREKGKMILHKGDIAHL